MPSDEEVNAAAKVFCDGVWNGFDPDSMMPTEQFDRFWNDGEGHQLYRLIARHALIAASGVAAEAEALANRQADMAAKERRETRLTILASIAIVGIVIAYAIAHISCKH